MIDELMTIMDRPMVDRFMGGLLCRVVMPRFTQIDAQIRRMSPVCAQRRNTNGPKHQQNDEKH